MSSPRETLDLGWDEVHRDAETLARLPALQRPWTGILAAARGGLIPAALLGHALGVRRIEVVSVSTYADRTAQEPRILGRPNLELDGDGWLLVDDLVDSGVTVRTIRALFPAVTVAVLYAKPAGEDLAHAFVRRVKQDTWIVFPWERTERAGASAGPAAEGLSPASHDPPSSTHVPPPRRDPASA
ncbi:MAG: hypothetical protein BGO51_07025 [Rhodospirillales bacterium 69-11]|nr:xanthine phosphoribosyltransferase [Rhodospirillales bacterium]OJW24077.1 MAG: hypothetical protein BGO51_07025 [Rhodospirillales bacterium 69-11]